MKAPVCVFGGTFNPPHMGHVRACLEAADEIDVARVGLMPAKVPPHKQTDGVTEHHRVAMVKRACEASDRLYPQLIELELAEPSYSVKTLQALREQHPEAPLIFIIGEDSWRNLTRWHQWQQLSQLCHLLVLRRATTDTPLASELVAFADRHGTDKVQRLHTELSGLVYFAQTGLQPISSTQLRKWLGSESSVPDSVQVDDWVSQSVLHYIKENRLYV